MARKVIESIWTGTNLTNINQNFRELYEDVDVTSVLKKDAERLIEDAQRIAAENKEVQKQLDDLILNSGDSTPEVIQARGGHELLNGRLNSIDDDIEDTAELANKYDDKTTAITNASALSYKKMNTTADEWLGNKIKLCVWGNSLAAGNGASSTAVSYPNRLRSALDRYSRSGQEVTLENRSIGGYYASQVNDEFPEPSGADISIISFGTNEYNKVQPVDQYTEALESIIEKEFRGGSAIVLTTMPQWGSKDWQVKESNGSMEDYNQIVHDLGNKYNIPVFDFFKETRNLTHAAFKNGEAVPHIHMSDVGYQMMSEKLAAFIAFQTPGTIRELRNGDFLGVRPGVDGIKFAGDYRFLSQSENYPTPSETSENKGIAVSSAQDEKVFHYAVNIDEDNLLLYPNFKFTKTNGTESLTVYVNNRNNPFHYSNPAMFGSDLDRSVATDTQVLNYAKYGSHASQYCTQNIYSKRDGMTYNLRFPTKGHYIVTVKVRNCDFFGFDCVAGNIIALTGGRQDSGWIPLSLSGVSNTDLSKPSAVRKVVEGSTTEIFLRIAVSGSTGQVFATLPSGFHPGQLTRLPAFSGTDNSGLVIGASGNLVATSGDSHDFRCTQNILL